MTADTGREDNSSRLVGECSRMHAGEAGRSGDGSLRDAFWAWLGGGVEVAVQYLYHVEGCDHVAVPSTCWPTIFHLPEWVLGLGWKNVEGCYLYLYSF